MAVWVMLLTSTMVNNAHAAAPPELVALLEDVTAADAHQYRTTDDQNVGMDTAKIIANPQGGYLAVYHHLINNVFQVRLATSNGEWSFPTNGGRTVGQQLRRWIREGRIGRQLRRLGQLPGLQTLSRRNRPVREFPRQGGGVEPNSFLM
jgi:hypothetical protein